MNDPRWPADVQGIVERRNGLVLRALSERDVPLRVLWFNDPINQSQMTLPTNVTKASTYEWLRRIRQDSSRHDFATEDSATGSTVAMCGVGVKDDERVPELYILVDPLQQGRGVGTATLGLLLDWLQSQTSFRGCRLLVSPANKAALALYHRFAFTAIASLPERNRILMELMWETSD